MHESTDIEVVRTEALRKLGRNILNFSKIEAGFKLLLSVSRIEGTTTTLRDNIKAKRSKLHKQTLGALVTEFNRTIFRDVEEPEPPKHLTKPWFSLSINVTPTNSEEWQQALRTLVEERNSLIHHDLADIDVTAIEDYRNLIAILDEQNPRLIAQLDNLKWMLSSLSGFVQDMGRSPELRQFLISPEEAKTEIGAASTRL